MQINHNRRLFISGVAAFASLGVLNALDFSKSMKNTESGWNVSNGEIRLKNSEPFDLRRTLPGNVAKGGHFSVASVGAALPDGVHLSPEGFLHSSHSEAINVRGVVFAYTEPTTSPSALHKG